ncbi:hypothetical protein [Lentzea albida]|uniref:Uncharacterized protein n=1 Tax=Lentzea albida TaxID=65499 RepID=A0A1H9W993_9PSEU|nr:hypothetical protein [Lentzea albida]SES30492.1 hypothetical protein SAMN04488000_12174 [Lentzea albida]
MVRYWGSFVRQGTPDAPGLAAWQGIPKGQVMVLRTGGSSAVSSEEFSAAHHCDLWSSIDYRWLDLDPGELARQVGVGL